MFTRDERNYYINTVKFTVKDGTEQQQNRTQEEVQFTKKVEHIFQETISNWENMIETDKSSENEQRFYRYSLKFYHTTRELFLLSV